MSIIDQPIGLHIEPTSRCTLACSRCERTEIIQKFKKKNFAINDIDIVNLEKFIDLPIEKIELCGNIGDPIYHRNFINLVAMLKQKSKRLTITTNGTGKNRTWWKQLNRLLEPNDTVEFSIDGTPENFTQYRINADWNSILTGIQESVQGDAKTEWKYIPFSYNEHTIDQARELATELGIDKFWLDYSDRWVDDDPLKPSEYIQHTYQYKQKYLVEQHKDHFIDPFCKSNTRHFIAADGHYAPCCYSKSYKFYHKSDWWKNRNKHSIATSKLSEQISYFDSFYNTIQKERYEYCIWNCGKC